MAKREPRNIDTHHKYFAVGCLLLLITTVWAFLRDHTTREYVEYQDMYRELEDERLKKEMDEVRTALQASEVEEDKLRDVYENATKNFKGNAGKIAGIQTKINKLNDELSRLRRELNFATTDLDVFKYQLSIGQVDLAAVEGQDKKRRDLFNTVQDKSSEASTLQKEIDELEKPGKEARKALETHFARRNELRASLKKLEGSVLLNSVRDMVGLDFVSPRDNLNDQKVLANLPLDFKFAKTQRVDRCIACHKAIDNPDPKYRKENMKDNVVMRSHPRLDLYVGAASSHSASRFGCTVCHQGRQMTASFIRCAHTPQNEEQKKEWITKYGWEPLNQHKPGLVLWDQPMLPLQYTEASCAKCHKGVDRVPEATKLNTGRELFRERGCVNCHIGNTDPDMAWMGRVGPDLRRIGEKTEPNWTRKWIENPWEFRPSTHMPRLFGLENRKSKPDTLEGPSAKLERDKAEIEAISVYLFAASKLREKKAEAVPPGDPAKGKALFESVGCVACHSAEARDKRFNLSKHGPDLSRVGEKLKPEWIYAWIRNPHGYWTETRMPSLRLSDDEAAQITAYLMKEMRDPNAKQEKLEETPTWAYEKLVEDMRRNTTPDSVIKADLEPERFKKLLRDALEFRSKFVTEKKDGQTVKSDTGQGEWNKEQIDTLFAKIEEMGGDTAGKDRLYKAFYVGQGLIQQYSCFACHNIQGFTNSPLACVNLAGEGDKDPSAFDFGHTTEKDVPRTRWDWLYTKVSRPRVFDRGREDVTRVLDRLKMPWFGYVKPEGKGQEHATLPGEHARMSAGGGHEEVEMDYTPAGNPDEASVHSLTPEEVERIVTVLLSLTQEDIPQEMQYHPTQKDVAQDRGERVMKGLNCVGCHQVGLETPILKVEDGQRGQIPLEAFFSTAVMGEAEKLGLVSTRDEFSLMPGTGNTGILHFGRATNLSQITLKMLFAEKQVRVSTTDAWQPAGLVVGKGDTPYSQLVSEKRFHDLVSPIMQPKDNSPKALEDNEARIKKAYADLSKKNIDKAAYERIAGTQALVEAPDGSPAKITKFEYQARLTEKSAWQPVFVAVRWTKGEGAMVPYIDKLREGAGLEPSTQFAPPRLTSEGLRVQPDWLYVFLRNIQQIRPSLAIRMPSFWEAEDPNAAKRVYKVGRLSTLNMDARPTGLVSEPVPLTDATIPDDVGEIVDYFNAVADEKPYGYQPKQFSLEKSKELKDIEKLLNVVKNGGRDCAQCHVVGGDAPAPTQPIGPDLTRVKWRIKTEWLRRWLIDPASLLPGTKMPSNFLSWGTYEYNAAKLSPIRGLLNNDQKLFNDRVHELDNIQYYLQHLNEPPR